MTGFSKYQGAEGAGTEAISPLTVSRQAALDMMRLSKVTVISALAAGGFLLVCMFLTPAPVLPPILWYLALIGVQMVRLKLDADLRGAPSDEAYRRWKWMVTAQQTVFGAIWGFLPWLPGQAETAPSFDLLVVASIPVAIGIMVGQTAVLRAGIASAATFSTLLGLFFITRGDTHNLLLGLFCLLMSGVHAAVAFYLQRLIFHVTRLRLGNERLLEVSEARHREAADAASRLQEILDCLDYGVTVYDSDLRLKAWNRVVLETNIFPSELVRVGTPIRDLVYGSAMRGYYGPADSVDEMTDSIVHGIQAAYRQGGSSWTFERADGRQFKVRNIVLSNGDLVISSDDITDVHEAMNQELQHVTRHCDLTGLLNRTAFRRDLETLMHTALADNHRIAMLTLDIEGFRTVNNTLGAEGGDRVLTMIAGRLRERAPEDALLARISGDEFAVATCGNLSLEDIHARSTEIIRDIEGALEIDGHPVVLSVNSGISVFPDHARQPDHLLAKAAVAQRAAKKGDQRSPCMFEESLGGEDEERNSLRLEIWRALAQKEFLLYFQPQVDLKTGRVIGAETLLRWLHPDFGWVPPGKFIPVAETSQQIVEITEWLLPAACREAKSWIGRGWTDFTVSVNISAVHFHAGDLVDLVYRSLVESGLPAHNLELELTESMLLPNAQHVTSILNDLGDLGVRLAIDDFGTGYSAMSYLRHFPLQKLKIDGSFVRELGREPESRSIIEAIAQVGHTLGNYVVAEGVETEEQQNILADIGCDGVQGYLYSKALPAEHFVSWVEQHNAQQPPQPASKPVASKPVASKPVASKPAAPKPVARPSA